MKNYITGCDKNTEWQLPWFIENFDEHIKRKENRLIIADFGMTPEMRRFAGQNGFILDVERNGWFSKVEAMMKVLYTMGHGYYCWLDTDCQVLRNPNGLFGFVDENKITMVRDHPWSKRMPQRGYWYNSGVVAFNNERGNPNILNDWLKECQTGNHRGDQEALHYMFGIDGMRKVTSLSEAPHVYNVLRLDVLDETVPKHPAIMHWTGAKGNDEIRRQMNEQ